MVCRYSGGAAQGLPQAQDYIRMVLEEAEVLHARVMAAFAKDGGAAGGGGGGKGGKTGGGGREETSSQYDAILRLAQAVLDEWQCVSWPFLDVCTFLFPGCGDKKAITRRACRNRRRCWTTGTLLLIPWYLCLSLEMHALAVTRCWLLACLRMLHAVATFVVYFCSSSTSAAPHPPMHLVGLEMVCRCASPQGPGGR